jgi:hypothetical protein
MTMFALVGVALAAGATYSEAQTNGPFQFNSLTPCRVFDSRIASTQAGYAFGGINNPPRNPGPITVRLQGVCGVPAGARAVAVNVTVVGPSHAGNMTLYPSNLPSRPVVSTINFAAGEPALANGAIVPLAPTSSGSDFAVYLDMAVVAPGGSLHVILDVTGYFSS